MNNIHPTAIVDESVELGTGNEIKAYCVLQGPLVVGNNNLIGPHVVIGSPGQDTRNPRYDSSNCRIQIGSNNIIREFSAIQKPAYADITLLGSDVFLMHAVHVPHDAVLEDKVVCAPMVVIGGLARIMEGANLGMGATVHQKSVIGPYSIVATGASAVKNVKPFSRFIPGKPLSVNVYSIQKFGFADYQEEIENYVCHNVPPESDVIREIVKNYLDFHESSGRPQY